MSESHDIYADEFRGTAPAPQKNPKTPAPDTMENTDGEFFTGMGEGITPKIGVGDQDGNEKTNFSKKGTKEVLMHEDISHTQSD